MKKILTILFLSLVSLNSFAFRGGKIDLSDDQFTDYVENTPEGLKVDVASICAHGLTSCKWGVRIKYRDLFDLKVQVPQEDGYEYLKSGSQGLILCDSNCFEEDLHNVKFITVSSNLDIVKFSSAQDIESSSNGKHFTLEDISSRQNSTYSHKVNYKKSIVLYAEEEEVTLRTVTIPAGFGNFKTFYDNAKTPMRNALKMIKKETLNFQRHMSKSDRNLDHFERFIVSLDDALTIIDDKKNFSILDWRIQEGMRRVVAFGMIISDLLWAYEDVPGAAKSIQNIRAFREEVRASYGWENTLAGNVSKTTSALLELVHYEISEIIKVKVTTGEDDSFGTYRLLTNRIRNLIVKINSSDGGDIQAGQHIGPLMETWNSPEWQQELKRLMEAKLDIRKLVRPKLKYILNAMLALEELIDNRRIYFEIETIKAAAGERPSRG